MNFQNRQIKILFILPYDRTYRYKGGFKKGISYAPLTLTTLAALVPKDLDAKIDICDEGVDLPKYSNSNYDLVCISCNTSSAPRAYFLCDYWKKKGSYVAIGGPHPTLMPEEAGVHADTIFIGLGEKTFPTFIYDYINNKPKTIYEHKSDEDTLSMPKPRRDLLNNKAYLNIPTIIANRGCTNKCEFCSINNMWDCSNIARPIPEVIDEIKELKCKRIIFLDPNMYAKKEYTKELLTRLMNLKIKWSGLSTISVANDPEMLDLYEKSGCEGLLLGLETLNSDNLEYLDKGYDDIEKYNESIKLFHKKNIAILGCFVLGFDNDTKESILKSIEMINKLELDLVRFAVLTPYPGTRLYKRLESEKRITNRDYSLYDMEHVVFEPKNMTGEELEELLKIAWKKTYTYSSIMKRLRNIKYKPLIKLAANLGFKYFGSQIKKDKNFNEKDIL